MIENEFLFLGLLAEGPKHGYEIKRQIEEDITPNLGLKLKSIYYPLQKMAEEGLVKQEVGRQGRFPEKHVYCITDKGKKKFDELIGESFLSIERPFFQVDLSLYFIHLTDKIAAKRRLKARMSLLKKISKELSILKEKSLPKSKSAYLILEHNLALVDTEILSTEKIIRQI